MKKFILDMLSNNNSVSSKRVLGVIGFVCSIIFIAIWQHDLFDLLLLTSASLVGLETVANVFKKK